jgi:hypothetical protein
MSKKTRLIEVVIGEKATNSDAPGHVHGTSAPQPCEVGGHSADAAFFFECPWCGAINHAMDSRDGVYVCFSCGRLMRPAMA